MLVNIDIIMRVFMKNPHTKLMRRDREVVDFSRSIVKNISELTNLMKMYRIEGYNGK